MRKKVKISNKSLKKTGLIRGHRLRKSTFVKAKAGKSCKKVHPVFSPINGIPTDDTEGGIAEPPTGGSAVQ